METKTPKLTVAVPVYNTSPAQLSGLLDCIYSSSLSDFEVIVLSDGSVRDYSIILEERKNLRFLHTENRGILSARKTLAAEAKGEYFIYADSDDEVSLFYHEALLLRAQKTGADLVVGDWAFLTGNTRYACTSDRVLTKNYSRRGEEVLSFFFEGEGKEHSRFVLWNKLVKTSLLRRALEECETYTEGVERLSYAEDALISYFLMKNAEHLENVHEGYYFYRAGQSGAVSVTSDEKLRAQIDSLAFVFEVYSADLEKRGGEKYEKQRAAWRALSARAFTSHAIGRGAGDLLPYIRERLGQKKSRPARLADDSAYRGGFVLPEPFYETERRLMQIRRVKKCAVRPTKNKYAMKSALALRRRGIDFSWQYRGADIVLPPDGVPLSKRIFFSRAFYTLGVLLFPKGSRLRALLKKVL